MMAAFKMALAGCHSLARRVTGGGVVVVVSTVAAVSLVMAVRAEDRR